MARLEIPLPGHFVFRTEMEIRITDINYGGHLGHDRLFSLLHEARVRFLAAHGYGELDIEGLGIAVADAAASYKAEVFHGERLVIEIGGRDFHRVGGDLVYRVSKVADGCLVAVARTGLVFMDYGTRRVRTAPAAFRALFDGGRPA